MALQSEELPTQLSLGSVGILQQQLRHDEGPPVTAVVSLDGLASEGSAPKPPAPQSGEQAGERQVCAYFKRTGRCAFSSSPSGCKFIHPSDCPPPVLNSRGYPLRKDEPDCAHYKKKGWCAFGMTCKFNHPELLIHPASFAPVASSGGVLVSGAQPGRALMQGIQGISGGTQMVFTTGGQAQPAQNLTQPTTIYYVPTSSGTFVPANPSLQVTDLSNAVMISQSSDALGLGAATTQLPGFSTTTPGSAPTTVYLPAHTSHVTESGHILQQSSLVQPASGQRLVSIRGPGSTHVMGVGGLGSDLQPGLAISAMPSTDSQLTSGGTGMTYWGQEMEDGSIQQHTLLPATYMTQQLRQHQQSNLHQVHHQQAYMQPNVLVLHSADGGLTQVEHPGGMHGTGNTITMPPMVGGSHPTRLFADRVLKIAAKHQQMGQMPLGSGSNPSSSQEMLFHWSPAGAGDAGAQVMSSNDRLVQAMNTLRINPQNQQQ